MKLSFIKGHALRNDFVIINHSSRLSKKTIQDMADRKAGIGFDQLITYTEINKNQSRCYFFNADGREANACGNGSRLLSLYLMKRYGTKSINLITREREIQSTLLENDLVQTNMGPAKFNWKDIPLLEEADTSNLNIPINNVNPQAVSVGNPHLIYFFPQKDMLSLVDHFGFSLEKHPLFPEATNVSFCFIQDEKIYLDVWERGTGLTEACGTAACAAFACAIRANLIKKSDTIHVIQKGGTLILNMIKNDILMTGSALITYEGIYNLPD